MCGWYGWWETTPFTVMGAYPFAPKGGGGKEDVDGAYEGPASGGPPGRLETKTGWIRRLTLVPGSLETTTAPLTWPFVIGGDMNCGL
jgi:hypothetical protein